MRKKIINQESQETKPPVGNWLDLERSAEVEITSEDSNYPIESALTASGPGWRASHPGEQVIRLLFEQPQNVGWMRLEFLEEQQQRTQEFALRWSTDGQSYREIVRQQYNFSPSGAGREVEEYTVELSGVKALELKIVPDIGGGGAVASLARWRIATR